MYKKKTNKQLLLQVNLRFAGEECYGYAFLLKRKFFDFFFLSICENLKHKCFNQYTNNNYN